MRRYDFKDGGPSYLPEHTEGRFVLYTGVEQQLQQARREADESAKDAFRRGWEQGKIKAIEIVNAQHVDEYGNGRCCEIADAIAAMEYGGGAND